MAQLLLAFGGLTLLVMGTYHGLLTLRDVTTPRAFTPTDDAVRLAMQGTRVVFNPHLNLWRAWLGFNLSHSLGVALFGGVVAFIAWRHFPVFAGNRALQALAAGVAAAYLAISLRFWFSGSSLGVGLALLCILGAAALA